MDGMSDQERALITKSRQWGKRPLFKCPACNGFYPGIEFFVHVRRLQCI
jgi:hypothetical protein